MTSQLDDDDLFDDDMEIFTDSIPSKRKVVPLGEGEFEEETPVDEEELREAMSQFSQRTQRGAAGMNDLGQTIRPRNDFETFLESAKCEIRKDENDDMYIFIGNNSNHAQLVQKLSNVLQNKDRCDVVLRNFEVALTDRKKLKLYLNATNSSLGRQDTIFRALLLCPSAQSRVFDQLMAQMQILGIESSEESDRLSLICVDQTRYLDCVYDSSSMLQSIFDRNIEQWCPAGRDELIRAIPEILCDLSTQEEAAIMLKDMILRDVSHENSSFRVACLDALQILRTSNQTGKNIRLHLTSNVMQFNPTSIPKIVSFALESIDDKEKNGLSTVLVELTQYLKIEKLRVGRGMNVKYAIDEVVCEIFAKITRYMQIVGVKGWKEIAVFLKGKHDESPDTDDHSQDGESRETGKIYHLFDILLSFSLMSLNGCPSFVGINLKNQVIVFPDLLDDFMKMCGKAFQYKKFVSIYRPAILSLAKQFVWSNEGTVRGFGSFLYKEVFVSVEKSQKETLVTMLDHLGKQDSEASAILDAIEGLSNEHMCKLAPFVEMIHKCLDLVEVLSIDNGRHLFKILVLIYTKDTDQKELKKDIEESISKFSRSVNERERMWAVIGILMQMEAELVSTSPHREANLTSYLETFENVTSSSVWLRSIGYQQMGTILREARCKQSTSILKWADELFDSFKTDFFEERPSNFESDCELENPKFIFAKSSTWLKPPPGRGSECVPIFELLKEVSYLRQRWTDEDSQLAEKNHWTQFEFIFEANISMDGLSVSDRRKFELNDVADSHYHNIQWLRTMVNTFSAAPDKEKEESSVYTEILGKRFQLMVEEISYLNHAVRQISEWPIPTLTMRDRGILVISERRAAEKISKKPVKKVTKGKRKRANDDAETNQDQQDEAENEPEEENVDEENGEGLQETQRDRFSKVITVADIPSTLTPLKLVAVIKLIKIPAKFRVTYTLFETLFAIIQMVLPKREKKFAPWMDSSAYDPSRLHGDNSTVWKCIMKAIPTVVSIIIKMGNYFKADLDASVVQDRRPELFAQRVKIMVFALKVLSAVLQSKDVKTSEDRGRPKRRQMIMERIEHGVAEHLSLRSSQNDEAELALAKLVVAQCELCPTLDVAAALLDLSATIEVWTDELKNETALHALSFLRREWTDPDGKPIKGAQLTGPIKRVLEHYLQLRSDRERLLAIQWLLSTKLSDLASKEKRKSTAMAEAKDPLLVNGEEKEPFASISRLTLSVVYRVLFNALNTEIAKGAGQTTMLQTRQVTPQKCAEHWEMASNCFIVLAMIIRLPSLRNGSILATACREGKRFLTIIGKNSSFMALLEDDHKVSLVSDNIQRVLRGVQMGNRILQNISVYAKTMKSASLLRLVPELRASNELFLRGVQSAVVRLQCEGAFTIGLLKSRNIDGEEIADASSDEEETMDQAPPPGEEEEEENGDDSRMSEVY